MPSAPNTSTDQLILCKHNYRIAVERTAIAAFIDMLQLYLTPTTVNSRKVLAGLDLIGAPFELQTIDFEHEEHKSEAFLQINPNGTVPAATDGDLALSESNAIMMYAADCMPDGSTAYPQSLQQRADANRWLLWEASVWFPTNYVFLTENVFKDSDPDQAVIAAETPRWHKNAAILDARLAKTGKWMLGDVPTIVDIAIAAPMHLMDLQRLPIDDHPNLKRWWAHLIKLPCWQKTQVAVDQMLAEDEA